MKPINQVLVAMILIATSLTVIFLCITYYKANNKKPIPKECKCTSAKEIILAYEQYQTFIDSVANPKYKSQHDRYADSINKINLILQQ